MDALARKDPAAETDFDPTGGVSEMSRDLYRAICRAIDARVAPYGLTSQSCRYLSIIRRNGGATAKELSDYLSVRSPTTLGALSMLESKRFISRTEDPKDGRKAIYVLTARGAEIEALVFESASEVERRATRRLSLQERDLFHKLANTIHDSILNDLAKAETAAPQTALDAQARTRAKSTRKTRA